MFWPNTYVFFVALSAVTIIFPTLSTLQKFSWNLTKIFKFLFFFSFLIALFSKFLGALGLFLATGKVDILSGPTSVMGWLMVSVFFLLPWALKQGPVGRVLLGEWSYLFPLAQSLGRIGCNYAGCCYIKPGYSFSWPLLEAVALLLLSAALYQNRPDHSTRTLFKIYLFSYLVLRFFLDFLRGDIIRGFMGPLSLPQWICLILFSWLSLDYLRSRHHNNRA